MCPARDALPVVLLQEHAADAVVAQELVRIQNENVARQICRHVDAVHLRGVAAAAEVVAGPMVRRANFGIDPVLHPRERLADGRALVRRGLGLCGGHQGLQLGDVGVSEAERRLYLVAVGLATGTPTRFDRPLRSISQELDDATGTGSLRG